MSHDPTPAQALLLFGLMARHGECRQAELVPTVNKADRDALVKARLIQVGKAGRSLTLRLTDDGWAWIPAHLDAGLPAAQRTLADLLARLGEHVQRSGQTLADIIGSKPEEAAPPARSPKRPRRRGGEAGQRKPKRPTPAALRKRIEAAYLALTQGRKNQMVRLASLRAELADLDRATLDAGLGRILKGDKTASLMRHDDPRQLDGADHEAAFSPRGEPFHMIWIAS